MGRTRWIALIAAAGAALVAAAAFAGMGAIKGDAPRQAPGPLPGSSGPYPETDAPPPLPPRPSLEVTLLKTVTMTSFGAYPPYQASNDALIVGLEYELTNTTSEQVAFSDAPLPELRSASGVTLAADPALTHRLRWTFTSYSSPPDLISPGVTVRTVAGFEVARAGFDAKAWTVSFGGAASQALPRPATKPAGGE